MNERPDHEQTNRKHTKPHFTCPPRHTPFREIVGRYERDQKRTGRARRLPHRKRMRSLDFLFPPDFDTLELPLLPAQ